MNIFELQQTLLKTTKILAGRNIDVFMEGFQPRVEYNAATRKPERIFIPALPEGSSASLVRAIHGYIDHECSHVMFSSADDLCDPSKDRLWGYIHNCIEDPRVNRRISDHFPGSKLNLQCGYNYLFNEFKDEDGLNAYDKEMVVKIHKKASKTPEGLAEFYLQYASLWFAGMSKCELNKHKFDELGIEKLFEPLMDRADPEQLAALGKIRTQEDARKAADYFSEFFSQEALEKMMPEPEEGKGGDKKSKKLSKGEIDKAMEKFKSLEEQLADAINQEVTDAVLKNKELIYWTDRFDKTISKHEMEKNYCRRPTLDIAGFEDETKQISNYLQKDLYRMLEERRRRYYVGGHKSGKLNAKSLFSVRFGNDRIFKKKNEIRDINASVSLLIDLSGSMSGSKVYLAMQSAYAFGMCLQNLKVPFEIYGFSTLGISYEMDKEYHKFIRDNAAVKSKIINEASPERFIAFKSFEDTFDVVSKAALCAASQSCIGMQQNEDSKHVKLALQRLSARPEKVKALFVFSDGEPCFHSHDGALNSMSKLRQLDNEAKSKYGVDIYSIGIQSTSVEKFYKQRRVVTKLDELPQALFGFLRKCFNES